MLTVAVIGHVTGHVIAVLCRLTAASDSCCLCRFVHHQLMMTSLCLPRLQATPSLAPPISPLQLSAVDNCCPWIQLYRRAAADLRNSVVDPRRLLLRLDTLPPPNFDQLDKVRVSDKQCAIWSFIFRHRWSRIILSCVFVVAVQWSRRAARHTDNCRQTQ